MSSTLEGMHIKPCPFCGYPGTITYFGPDTKQRREFAVGCSNGKCCALYLNQLYLIVDHGHGEVDRAVAEWNKRA